VTSFDVSTSESSWSLVDFTTEAIDVEFVSDTLWSHGVVAIEEINTSGNTVILRTSMGEDPEPIIQRIALVHPSVSYSIIQVSRSVADTWREHAEPTWVNDSVVLVPAWVAPPAGFTPIFIEPADTFGLGNHPTTVLALRCALELVPRGCEVFDLGCGSGVLGIALAKLLHCRVQMYDIAESAHAVVEKNCQINDVDSVTWTDGIQGSLSDVVVANILAPVLIAESAHIQQSVRPSGLVILSGIRDDQVAKVLDHYVDFIEVLQETSDGWTAVALSAPRNT
jgi:ribosomal protein L11 methyltransferase